MGASNFIRTATKSIKTYFTLKMSSDRDFYLRYYVGHKGKFGHEFLEFEFRPDGKLRYANNSNYKNDTMIRKEAYSHQAVMDELRRIIEDSEIMAEDDELWPQPDRVGRQELEIVIGDEHISFTTSKIGSLVDVNGSRDPDGLRCFLLPGPGSEVLGVLPHRAPFQDQAHLNERIVYPSSEMAAPLNMSGTKKTLHSIF